jgi:hypothetical protein
LQQADANQARMSEKVWAVENGRFVAGALASLISVLILFS